MRSGALGVVMPGLCLLCLGSGWVAYWAGVRVALGGLYHEVVR